LIIAHNNLQNLSVLLQLLDDERNGIYLHVDKKCTEFVPDNFKLLCQNAKLTIIEPRRSVCWGGASMIEVTMALFREAHLDVFDYYHLLSGADLPIKPMDVIDRFFTDHQGKEFIGFSPFRRTDEGRLRYYHFFVDTSWFRKSRFVRIMNKALVSVQKMLALSRNYTYKGHIRRGPQWISITNAFVGDLLNFYANHSSWFRFSFCCDEIIIQTYAYNSSYRERLFSLEDEFYGCMRLIDWSRGGPYTFVYSDIQELINSDMLFARKFSDEIDFSIIRTISNILTQR